MAKNRLENDDIMFSVEDNGIEIGFNKDMQPILLKGMAKVSDIKRYGLIKASQR